MVDASGPKFGLRVTKRLLERLIGGRPVSGRADRGAERAAATQLEGRQDGGASGLPVSGGGESTSSGTGDGNIDVIGGERGSYTNSEDIKRALAQSVRVSYESPSTTSHSIDMQWGFPCHDATYMHQPNLFHSL